MALQIAKQLRKVLKERDVTVAQLARATGISAKTIHNWLSEQQPGSFDQVKAVADELQVTLDYLCYGVESQRTKPALEEFENEINAGLFEVVLRRVKR